MSLRLGGGPRKGGADDRMKKYKAHVDADEGRRRREEGLVEIRKNKRGDSLAKKRREIPAPSASPCSSSSSADGLVHAGAAVGLSAVHDACCQQHSAFHVKLENISEMGQQLWSEDDSTQMEAAIYFRKLVSLGRNPPLGVVVRVGIVPRMVQFLLRKDKPELQFEAAWTLTNLASADSEYTQVVVKHGAVPILVQLLSSPNEEIREQAVWALGNVSGDSPICRDAVLENGVLTPLISLLNPRSRLSMLRNASWTLSNIFRFKPLEKIDQIQPALSVLQQLIYSKDDDILENACRALSFFSNGTHDRIQTIIDANICPRLMELLRHPTPSILDAALVTLGNIATGDETQTQFIIDNGLLLCLLPLLTQHHPNHIKREACWIISNITAGSKSQIQAVIDANIIRPLVHLLEYAEFAVKKEVAWTLSNAISGGSIEQIHFLVRQGCIKPLCDLLTCSDVSILLICLGTLEKILEVGDGAKCFGNHNGLRLYLQEVEDCGGLDKIENLQSHDDSLIYDKAIKLLENYWEEDEEEGVNLQGMDDASTLTQM